MFNDQRSWIEALNAQKQERQKLRHDAKEQDRVFAEMQDKKLAMDDEQRAKHFLKLQDFQKRNEAKYQALRNYQIQGNLEEAAKRDEERMLKGMEERQRKEEKDAARQRDIDFKTKSDASKALRLQIAEKKRIQMLQKQSDELYAN